METKDPFEPISKDVKYGKRPLYTPKDVIAIGDVHNMGDKLESLLQQVLPELGPEDHLVFCGDLINRGDQAAKVIQLTSDLVRQYPGRVFFVYANHEQMLMQSYLNGDKSWNQYLGTTLIQWKQAYGWEDCSPTTVKKWLSENPDVYLNHLIPYYETKDVIVTHAPLDSMQCEIYGIESRPEGILDRMHYEIRWGFVPENDRIEEIKKFLICGHQYAHHGSPRIFKQRCFIDTGCGKNNTAPCTAIKFPGKKYWQSTT